MSKEANGVTFEGKEDFDTKKPHNEAQEHTMKGLCKKGQQRTKDLYVAGEVEVSVLEGHPGGEPAAGEDKSM